jgi:hypothetical protein
MPSDFQRRSHLPGEEFLRTKINPSEVKSFAGYRIHFSDKSPGLFSSLPSNRYWSSLFDGLYIGRNVQTCLDEVFSDQVYEGKCSRKNPQIAKSAWTGRVISKMRIEGLSCFDLSNKQIREACGVDLGTLMSSDLKRPQKWAAAITSHPNQYNAIIYQSRFSDEKCLVAYDRGPVKVSVLWTKEINQFKASSEYLLKHKIALI